jgi:hypothetical protein
MSTSWSCSNVLGASSHTPASAKTGSGSAAQPRASALAEHSLGKRAHEPDLFEEVAAPAPPVAVLIDKVRVERSRTFEDVAFRRFLSTVAVSGLNPGMRAPKTASARRVSGAESKRLETEMNLRTFPTKAPPVA